MKLDAVIIPVEPRTIGGCIDLAGVFVRIHARQMLRLLLLFGVPFCGLVWWLADEHEWPMALILTLFAFVSPFFGATLVASAGRRVFGEPLSLRAGLGQVLRRLPVLFMLLMVARLIAGLGAFVLIVPAYVISARYGYLSEVLLLEQVRLTGYESRLSNLLSGRFAMVFGRLVTLMTFYTMSVLSLFVLVDQAASVLFGLPVLSGRMSDSSHIADEMMYLLNHDPVVITTLIACLCVMYPLARLAWFFSYLDARIRQEGWDVELAFRIEAQRLEAGA